MVMSTRKVKDAKDLSSNELIYFKGHAKATYMSNGATVEDAINSLQSGGSGSVDLENYYTKAEIDAKGFVTDIVYELPLRMLEEEQGLLSDEEANAIMSAEIVSLFGYMFSNKTCVDENQCFFQTNFAGDGIISRLTIEIFKRDGVWNYAQLIEEFPFYSKPEDGIPASDLSSSVQESLNKANTALQTHQDLSGKQDVLVSGTNIKTINGTSLLGKGNITISSEEEIAEMGFTKNTGTITAVQANGTNVSTSGTANIPAASTSAYGVTKLSSSTSSTSTSLAATASAVKSAYDLANGKQDKLTSGTNIKTINGESILGSGNIAISGGGGYLPLSGGEMTGTIITPADDTKGIIPKTNNYGTIGTSSKKFYTIYASTLYGNLNWSYITDKPTIPSEVTESTVSGWGFTKNTGTVTSVKINGTTKSPSNGVVDLGTVGGEDNVQADWNVTDSTSDAYIKNKPTFPDTSNFVQHLSYQKLSSTSVSAGYRYYNTTSNRTISSHSGFSMTNPDAIIYSTYKMTFNASNFKLMDGLNSLVGSLFVYCLTWVPTGASSGFVAVNGAIYS